MKTNKLEVEYDFDFDFIGIISSLKPHKLAWIINDELKISLKKNFDTPLDFINEGKLIILSYDYEVKYSYFRLIRNKSSEFINIASPFLIPELKEYDYFVQLMDESCAFDVISILEKLRVLIGVDYVKQIEVENLKSKDNLIF